MERFCLILQALWWWRKTTCQTDFRWRKLVLCSNWKLGFRRFDKYAIFRATWRLLWKRSMLSGWTKPSGLSSNRLYLGFLVQARKFVARTFSFKRSGSSLTLWLSPNVLLCFVRWHDFFDPTPYALPSLGEKLQPDTFLFSEKDLNFPEQNQEPSSVKNKSIFWTLGSRPKTNLSIV